MDWASGNAVFEVTHVFLVIALEALKPLTLFFELVDVRTGVWSLVPATSLYFCRIARSIFALSEWLQLP